MTFVEAQDKELAAWMEENVTFPNSMVDRITPATRPEDVERLNAQMVLAMRHLYIARTSSSGW